MAPRMLADRTGDRISPMTTIWIDIPNGRLAAEDEGDGPPVLLVHSAIVNRRSWDPVVPHLVEAGYRVIRYDMRGFGESTTEEIEYRPHADVVAVLDHFGVERAAIGGNSMGGAFALDAVLETPDRFVAYVWVGAGIGGFEKPADPAEDELFEAEGKAEDDERMGPRRRARHAHLGRRLDRRGQPADVAGRPGGPRGDQGLGSRAPRAGPGLRLVQAAGPAGDQAARGHRGADARRDRRAGHHGDARGRGGGRPPGARRADRAPAERRPHHRDGGAGPLAALIVEHLAPLPRWS